MCSRSVVALGIVGLVCTLALAAGDKPDQPTAGVFKFGGLKQGNFMTRPCWMVTVAPVGGGGAIEMILPNKDSNAKKLDPIEAFYDIVKAAKMGDLLEIEQTKISNKPAIRGLKTYTMKPGEDEPNVFVYGGVSSKGDQTVITLTKFLQPATLAIASKKDAAGKMTPDADLMTAVNAFKDGDSVEVQTAGQNLKSIKAYVAPRKVEFVKVLRQQKVGDKEYTGIEVKDNTVLLVNPRTSAPVLDKLGTLKAGESYLVKTTNEGGTEWLTDIKPAPKEEAPKDAPKDAPKK